MLYRIHIECDLNSQFNCDGHWFHRSNYITITTTRASNTYFMHILDGEKFNNVKQNQKKWGRNGRTGGGGGGQRFLLRRQWALSCLYIPKKASITCKTPIMIHGQTFDINNNPITHASPHLQNIFAAQLCGWNNVTCHKYLLCL